MITFLCSDDASFITGAAIAADGGYTRTNVPSRLVLTVPSRFEPTLRSRSHHSGLTSVRPDTQRGASMDWVSL